MVVAWKRDQAYVEKVEEIVQGIMSLLPRSEWYNRQLQILHAKMIVIHHVPKQQL
jgi:hypothetical protein